MVDGSFYLMLFCDNIKNGNTVLNYLSFLPLNLSFANIPKRAYSDSQTSSDLSSLWCSFLPLIFLPQFRGTHRIHSSVFPEYVFGAQGLHITPDGILVTLISGGQGFWEALCTVAFVQKYFMFLFYNPQFHSLFLLSHIVFLPSYLSFL